MKYIWILKYILHKWYHGNGYDPLKTYGENGMLVLFTFTPIIVVLGATTEYFLEIGLYLVLPILVVFQVYVEWKDGFIEKKYDAIRANRASLDREFMIVRVYMVLSVLFTICVLAFFT